MNSKYSYEPTPLGPLELMPVIDIVPHTSSEDITENKTEVNSIYKLLDDNLRVLCGLSFF